jgi:hypothetical protein
MPAVTRSLMSDDSSSSQLREHVALRVPRPKTSLKHNAPNEMRNHGVPSMTLRKFAVVVACLVTGSLGGLAANAQL